MFNHTAGSSHRAFLVAGSAALPFVACGSSKATSSATSKAGTATTTASGAATTPAAAAGGAKLKIAFVMGCVGGEYSLGSPYQISSTFLALASASAPTFIAWKNGSDPRRRPGAGTQARRPGPCPTDPKALQSSPDEFPEEHYERAWPDRPTLDALNAIGRRGLGLAVST